MAQIKRKGHVADDSTAQKRARVGAEDRKKDNKKQKTNASEDGAVSKPANVSVLRDDEPAFPRGGASILTPLERKQIHNEATRDVLFEQKGSKNSSGAAGEEDEDGDDDVDVDGAGDSAAAKKPRKQRKTKAKKRAEEKKAADKKGVRVEGLNFKVCSRAYLPMPNNLYLR